MRKHVRRVFNLVHKKFGGPRTVTLVVGDLTKYKAYGVCAVMDEPNTFTIFVEESLNDDLQVYMMIHEYAHTLTPEYGAPHGPSWGVVYSAIYSFLFDDVSVIGKRRKRKTRIRRSKK